jgi:hypothetical protein
MHNMLADVSLRSMGTTIATAMIAIVYITIVESLLLILELENDTLRRSYNGPVQAIASMFWRRGVRYNKGKTERSLQW